MNVELVRVHSEQGCSNISERKSHRGTPVVIKLHKKTLMAVPQLRFIDCHQSHKTFQDFSLRVTKQ